MLRGDEGLAESSELARDFELLGAQRGGYFELAWLVAADEERRGGGGEAVKDELNIYFNAPETRPPLAEAELDGYATDNRHPLRHRMKGLEADIALDFSVVAPCARARRQHLQRQDLDVSICTFVLISKYFSTSQQVLLYS